MANRKTTASTKRTARNAAIDDLCADLSGADVLGADALRVLRDVAAVVTTNARELVELVRSDPKKYDALAHDADLLAPRMVAYAEQLSFFAEESMESASCRIALAAREDADWLREFGDEPEETAAELAHRHRRATHEDRT